MTRLSLLSTALLIAATNLPAAEAPRPNFVLINIDDLGYADIGPFGSTLNRTPNLDKMAAEGRKLTSFYAAPVCSPSRSALMTGCYPKRVLPISGVLFPAGAVGLNPNEVTVAEVLKGAGYATGCVGKWHLGDQPEFLPTAQGFDYYYGIPYSNDMGMASEGSKSNPGEKIEEKLNARPANQDETGLRGSNQPPLPIVENHTVVLRVTAKEQAELVKRYTEKAVGFLEQHQKEPFFLYLPHSAVHFPLYPGEDFMGKSKNGLRGDWVEEVDWSVGQVFAALKRLKLDQNTLVIFTSDNGGPLQHKAVNTPLRGGKAQTWEGGIRVCTIAWWPGHVPAGTSSDAITGMFDILPTFAALGGGKAPTDRKLDGVDISSVLTEVKPKGLHNEFYVFSGFDLQAVRSGDWKLHLEKGELYNLAKDIGESTDVAAANPDVVKKLRGMAQEMDSDLGTKKVGPGCRTLGRVENPEPLIHADGSIRKGYAP